MPRFRGGASRLAGPLGAMRRAPRKAFAGRHGAGNFSAGPAADGMRAPRSCVSPSPVEILYEDGEIVVVNKPAGRYVHASPGHEDGAIADELARKYPEMAAVGSAERPGVVHRLDAGTSGVMVFARTQRAYIALRRAFEAHTAVRKTYLAIVHGAPTPREGRLETTIGRKSWDARRMAIAASGGKRAVTSWRTLARRGGLSLVEFKIETGRTHQIRVTAAHLGAPVAGDALYGDAKADSRMARRPQRPLLHAAVLEFPHPADGRKMVFGAPPPGDFL